jgi:serine/threonine protein kinase
LLLDRFDPDHRCQSIKLADFGEARVVAGSNTSTPCGSIEYAAPEQALILSGESSAVYGRAADMWAVGMLMYALLSGMLPYSPYNYVVNEDPQLEQRWSLISHEAKQLLQSLLQFPPLDRPVVRQTMQHPWFAMMDQPQHPVTPLSTPGQLRELAILPSAWQYVARLSAHALVPATSANPVAPLFARHIAHGVM